MDRRRFLKRVGLGSLAMASVPALQDTVGTPATASAQASHVRWDILNLDTSTTPPTFRAGGVAFASINPDMTIQLMGSGTFVAPASGGTSHAVTGGGTWTTFEDGVATGSGTFQVMGLASWQFANMSNGTFLDAIGDV